MLVAVRVVRAGGAAMLQANSVALVTMSAAWTAGCWLCPRAGGPRPDMVIATWLGLLGIGLGTYISRISRSITQRS